MRNSFLIIAAGGFLILAGCTSPTQPTTPDDGKGQSALHAQHHAFYEDQPFMGPGSSMTPVATPAHEWHMLPDGRLSFLHWDNDDPMRAEKLAFYGDAVGPLKGCRGTGGISQPLIDHGYNHFHKLHASDFAQGHHMDPANKDATGYWLRHINANDGSTFMGLDSTRLAQNPLRDC